MKTPTLAEIKSDYNEIVALFNGETNVEILKRKAEIYHLTIEVNGDTLERYDGEKVRTVRIETYNNLSYVYFIYNEKIFRPSVAESIYFDVWSSDVENEFLVDITIDKLESAYVDGLEYVITSMEHYIDYLEDHRALKGN